MAKNQQRNFGRIEGGRIRWIYPDYRMSQIADFQEGQFVVETIKPMGAPKTTRQLGYYFAVILPTIHNELLRIGFDVMGVPITLEQCDAIVKHYCHIEQKRNLTKCEASKFLSDSIAWANTTLRIVIPEPK